MANAALVFIRFNPAKTESSRGGRKVLSIKNSRMGRIMALALAAYFIYAALLSGAFILTHENHEHDHNGIGGNCTVCVQIHNQVNLLKQLSVAFVAISRGLIALFAILGILCSALSLIKSYTPVTLKIRLNN